MVVIRATHPFERLLREIPVRVVLLALMLGTRSVHGQRLATEPTDRTSTAATQPVAGDSSFVPNGYVKVFGDEFNGSSLDLSKWWTRYIYDNGMLDSLNDEKERYREDGNHVMTGSTLKLVARKTEGATSDARIYKSGMIRSKITMKFGYFEARIKVPGAMGVWPAFWLNSDARADGHLAWPPEVDIFEFVNNGKDDRPNMLHAGAIIQGAGGHPRRSQHRSNPWGGELIYADPSVSRLSLGGGEFAAAFKFPDDFHVFALLWDLDRTLTWFIDGKAIMKRRYRWVYADGTDAPNAHVLLNLAVGGNWAGRYGIDAAAFPQAMEIDYVRVYQKKGSEQIGHDHIGRDLYRSP
jgi:beta-glucanase (GH16 family)